MLEIPENQVVLGLKEICEILPHRYPFLLVDKIIHLDLDKGVIVGQKNLTINEQFFQGHFPGIPIMPGVLILEALAQAGGILAHKKGLHSKIAVFLKIDNVKFRKPARPGDILYLRVEGLHFGNKGARVRGEAFVNRIDDKPAVEAEIACAMVDSSQI